MQENPLLRLGRDIPWTAIEPGHVEPAVSTLVAQAEAAIASIGASDASDYASVLDALEHALEPLSRAMAVVSHLDGVAASPALREAYGAVRPKVAELYGKLPLDPKLYARLVAAKATEDARGTLDPVRRRHLDKTLDDFRRHGAELDEAGKKRLSEIDVALAQVTNRFSNHVLDATNAFELILEDEARLSGLPDSARAMARASAESKGKKGYRFTLQAPSVIAVLTYLDDASIRKTVWQAFNRRAADAPHDNAPLVAEILALRAEKAKILGKADFADLVLEDRMAKTGEKAMAFVHDLTVRTRAAFAAEMSELFAFREELEGTSPALEPWDVGYYAEKLRAARFEFDEEELRPYFADSAVLRGLFEIAGRLYGVRFEEREEKTWDPSVRTFAMFDGQKALGHFYVDLYPRENKRAGAWMASLLTAGRDADGTEVPNVALFCANATPPTGDGPALLTHDEVTTLFHEFGHLLHHMLSTVDVRSLAGTNVAWDFVELPSQIHENWAWEREALDLFARHVETGETIPDALLLKMRRARTFRGATQQMRQLGFATLDLRLHREPPPSEGQVLARAREIMAPFAPTALPANFATVASFSHLFSSPVGYAAAYYSYKWAEVLDADAFSRFLERGIFDPATGKAFKDAVLSRGDSEDPMALFVRFMGREPELGPLLRRTGIPETRAA